MGGLSVIDALDYLALLAEVQPERVPAAAIRWHGRLESQFALAALASLCTGDERRSTCCGDYSGERGLPFYRDPADPYRPSSLARDWCAVPQPRSTRGLAHEHRLPEPVP